MGEKERRSKGRDTRDSREKCNCERGRENLANRQTAEYILETLCLLGHKGEHSIILLFY